MICWKMKYMDDMARTIHYKTSNNKARRRRQKRKEAKSIANKLSIEAKRRLRYPHIRIELYLAKYESDKTPPICNGAM